MSKVHLALAGVLALVLVAPAQAQKNKKDKKPTGQILQAEKVFKPGQVVVAKLGLVAGNVFTLRLEYSRLEPKQGARGGNQSFAARPPRRNARSQRRPPRPSAPPVRVVKEFVNVEVEMASGIVIRTAFVPVVFDEKGEPKKLTPQELKELKGPNPKVPGYKADVRALKAGQTVKVTLAKNKETENKLRATRILVLEESNEPEKPPKKKKNK
jgi:hypothetical protein